MRRIINSIRPVALLVLGVGLLAGFAPQAWADTPGVARVSLVQGDVSMLRQGAQSWSAAVLNTPLVQGDEIYVPGQGRAEIEFDYADVARLAAGSDVRIASFDGNRLQLQLKSGTISFTAIGDHPLGTEIDTPNMSVRPTEAGTLRIDVVDASHTSATVWNGNAQVFTPQGSVVVRAGQQVQVEGSDNPQFRVVDAPAQDAWDQWVRKREDRILQASDYRDHYVNPEVYGGEDLDYYGHWVSVPGYGRCWTPLYTIADWSPYYYGRWAWTPYYGWSWVSYEPWGWAPYHYGRWFWRTGFGWCWWPGAFGGPHWWAPAYVDFFIGGPRWGLSFGFGGYGGIGWVPLAPYEPYYGYSRARYITNITNVTNIYNITNVTNVNGANSVSINGVRAHYGGSIEHLANARVRGGIIAVSQRGFATGRVDQVGRVLPVRALSGVNAVRGTAPVAPTRASLDPMPGMRAVAAPARVQNQGVFSRHPTALRPSETMRLTAIDSSMARIRTRAGLPARVAAAPVARREPARGLAARPGSPTAPAGRALSSRAAGTGRGLGQVAADTRATRTASPAGPRFEIVRPNASGGARSEARAPAPAAANEGGWQRFGASGGASQGGAVRGNNVRLATPPRFGGDRGGASGRFENHPIGGGAKPNMPARGNAPSVDRGGPGRGMSAPARSDGGRFENHPAGPSAPARDSGSRAPVRRTAPATTGPRNQRSFLDGGRFENHPMAAAANFDGGASRGFGPRQDGWSRGSDRGIAAANPGYRAEPSYRPEYRSEPAYRSAPEPRYSAPRYSSPRYSAPRYSAPHYSAPHYSAPSYHVSAPARSYRGGGGRVRR